MTTVRAAIEQISNGQIGHPAACIIESNQALSCGKPCDRREFRCARIMAWRWGSIRPRRCGRRAAIRSSAEGLEQPSTRTVDNFVDNLPGTGSKSSIGAPRRRLLKV
jgi:hypothetical protein